MKKLIIMSVISYLGLTHYAIAEERSIQETVEATDTATDTSGYQPTVQGNKSTAAADNESRISKGGLFLEPMLTGSREDSTIRTAQLPFVNSDTSGNLTGYGVGLRLSLKFYFWPQMLAIQKCKWMIHFTERPILRFIILRR
jgi:hypothetical protein